jgi:hypothetical protein
MYLYFIAFIITMGYINVLDVPEIKVFEEKSLKELSFQSGQTLKVSIINGSVHVNAWDKESLRIEIRKVVHAKDSVTAYKILKEIIVNIDNNKDGSWITTELPEEWNVSIEFSIFTPAATTLDINMVNGVIICTAIERNITSETKNGDIVIITAPHLKPIIEAKAINGNVIIADSLITQEDSKNEMKIEAKTINGNIIIK